MEGKTFSVELGPALAGKLEDIAERSHRSTVSLVAEAIEQYVEHDVWLAESIEAGLRAADEGRTVDHRKVRDWVESWGTRAELPPPKCG